MTTQALSRSFSMLRRSTYPSYATPVAVSGASLLLGVLACLMSLLSPLIAVIASISGGIAFVVTRAVVAKRRHEPEPFVHGPTILPPGMPV